MMAKDPDERYQSAREILRDLARVRDGLAVELAQLTGNGVPAALDALGDEHER